MKSLAMCVLLAIGAGATAESTAPQMGIPYKAVHTEVGGGADSAVSPDGKFIAFSSRRNGNLDVYTVEVATGAIRQITTNPYSDNEARWHPDSTHLIFVTMRNGSQDVYTIDLETLEETPIATEDFNEDYPSYSQDGTLACFTGGPRGFREVQVYDFATGKIRTVTRGYGYVGSTNFSPDNKSIVFHTYFDNSYMSGKSDVFIVPAAGGKPVNITKDADVWDYKPSWSFDGEWITFSRKETTPNFNIFVMRPDGSERRQLTYIKGPVPLRGGQVSMSNSNVLDQRWSNWTRDGRIGWHQINAQAGQLRAVNAETGASVLMHEGEFAVNDLTISPDGSRLVFEADAIIYVADAASTAKPEAVAEGWEPRWTGDGNSIAYLAGWPARPNRLSLSGGETVTIDANVGASWPASVSDPWSPDGARMALIRQNGGDASLVVVSADGDEKVLVAKGASKTAPVWSRDGAWIFYEENIPPSVTYCISDEPVRPSGTASTGAR